MDFAVSAQEQDGRIAIVSIQGEVDVYTAPRLREEIHKRLDAGANKLVVDLTNVAYMDSSGLGVLIGALKRAREDQGELVVAAANNRISRILDVTGLTKIFNVQPDVASALESLKVVGA